MALPATVGSLNTNAVVILGPFKSSGGSFYFIGRDSTTATTLRAMKSSDPSSVSFTSAATSTGFSTAILGLGAFQQGDTIHIALHDGSTASCNLKYLTFTMGSDTFSSTESVMSAANVGPTTGSITLNGVSIQRRSTGDLVFFYNGPVQLNMSTNYAAVYYRVRTGTNTYGTQTQVSAGATSSYQAFDSIMGSSDLDYLFYSVGSGTSLLTRTLNSSGTLSAVNTNTGVQTNALTSGSITYCASRGGTLVDGGTTYVIFAGKITTTQIAQFNSSGGTITTGTAVTNSSNASQDIRANGATYYMFTSDPSTGVLVQYATSTDHGSTFGAETTAMTATTNIGPFSKNCLASYTNAGGSTVVPYCYLDSSTWTYNEVSTTSTTNKTCSVTSAEAVSVAKNSPKLVTVAFAESVTKTAGKLATKAINTISIGQVITRLSQFVNARTFNVSIGQTVTKGVRWAHTILVAMAEAVSPGVIRGVGASFATATYSDGSLVQFTATTIVNSSGPHQQITLTKKVSHIIFAAWAEAVSLVTSKSGGGTLLSVAWGESVTLTRRVSHAVSVALAEVVTLSRVTSFLRTILVSTSEAVTLSRAAKYTKTILVLTSEAVTLTRSMLKTIVVSIGEAVTLSRVTSFLRTILVSTSEAVTLSRVTAHVRTILVSIGETVTLTRTASYLRTLLVSIGEAVTLSASLSRPRTVTLSTGEAVTLSRVTSFLRTLLVSIGEAVTLSRVTSYLRTILVSTSEVVTTIRTASHFRMLLVSTAEAVTLSRVTSFLRTLLVSTSGAMTLSAFATKLKTVLVSTSEVVTLLKFARKTIVVASAEVVTLTRRVAKTIVVAIAEIVMLAPVTAGKVFANVSSPQLVTLAARTSFRRLVTLTTAPAVTLTTSARHLRTILVSQGEALALLTSRAATRTLSVAIGASVTLLRGLAARRTILVSQGEAVTLSEGVARRLSIGISSSSAVSLARRVGHLVSVSIGEAVSLATTRSSRTVAIVVASPEAVTLSARRTLVKSIALAIGESVSLARQGRHFVFSSLVETSNVSLVRTATRTLAFVTDPVFSLGFSLEKTIYLATSEVANLSPSAVYEHTIVIAGRVSTTLHTTVVRVVEFSVDVAVGIGQLVRLILKRVKGRPHSRHLRAWEVSETLVATEAEQNLTATEPSASLDVTKMDPNLRTFP